MILDFETDIAAPPAKVWRVLTEFGAYPRWHPHREVEGVPVLGAKVKLKLGWTAGQRRTIKGKVAQLIPNEVLAFETGGLLGVERETFTLEATPRGTHLRHRVEIGGLMGFLIFRSSGGHADRLRAVHEAGDKALERHAVANTSLKVVSRNRPRTRP